MQIADRRFVITGGASLIGSHVADRLLAEGAREVVLLDIDMPVLNGLDACLEMQRRFPAVKVIALTMYNQPSL